MKMLKITNKISVNNYLIVIALIYLLMSCKSNDQQQNIDSKFVFKKKPNGRSQILGALINGKKEGFWVELNDSGKVVSENIYFHDSLNGENINYYDDGTTIASRGILLNDKRDGDWIFYYSNTKIAEKGVFINGVRAGIWEYYLEDGRLNKKIEYKKNSKIEILNNHLLPPTPDEMLLSNSDSNNRVLVLDSQGKSLIH